MTRQIVRVISTALMAYIVIMSATVILGSMADDGIILEAWIIYRSVKYWLLYV